MGTSRAVLLPDFTIKGIAFPHKCLALQILKVPASLLQASRLKPTFSPCFSNTLSRSRGICLSVSVPALTALGIIVIPAILSASIVMSGARTTF